MKAFNAIVLAVLFSARMYSSALSTAAANLQPGQWVEVSTVGLNYSLLTNGCIGNILGYSDSAMWNSTAKTFTFMGSPHCGGTAGNHYKLIQYTEATNSWTSCVGSDPSCPASYIQDNSHAYDHSAIDSVTQTWYRRWDGSNRMSKFGWASGAWQEMPRPTLSGCTSNIAGALSWFPELFGNGGLALITACYGDLSLWNSSTNQWSTVTGYNVGNYHLFSEYNPIHKVVVFGGGTDNPNPGDQSRKVFKLSPNGQTVAMNDAPFGLGIQKSVFTVDPVSGDYLVFVAGNTFHKYNPISDSWTTLPNPPFTYTTQGALDGIIAAPVSNHGVIMVLKYDGDSSKVWIYKHQGTPPVQDTIPPSPPSNLHIALVQLDWTASTDNIGVTGYRVFDSAVQIAETSSTSVQVSLSSGVHVISVQAVDAVGNVSASSNPMTLTIP